MGFNSAFRGLTGISSEEINPQLLIREFLKLTGWNVDSSFLCFWVPKFCLCLCQHLVDTNGFLPIYSKSCAYLQVPNFGHSHQCCVSSIMSPICREHGNSIFTHSSTSSSYLYPYYFAFSSQTITFVQINFSNPAVCYIMVCLQQPPGPIWMSTEIQDLSKQFHSLTNYLHHLFSSGNNINLDIQWGDQYSVADERVSKAYRVECWQLILSHCCVSEFWNSISAYVNIWWTQMVFCPNIPNPVLTFRCRTLGTHISGVYL